MTGKTKPFLRQLLNSPYDHKPFGDLKMSTMTIDVRFVEDAGIKFEKLYELLPVVSEEIQSNFHEKASWPPGAIIGIKFKNTWRGRPPKKLTRGFKNSITIWIWLKEKRICVKISGNDLHMTGCKSVNQAVECAKYIQQHIHLLKHAGEDVYDVFPHVTRYDVCMINYNFNLKVGIDLGDLDDFICERYPDLFIAPYDQNIHGTTMPLELPCLSTTYTIHDNGQVCMCTNEIDLEEAMKNISKSHDALFTVLSEFRET